MTFAQLCSTVLPSSFNGEPDEMPEFIRRMSFLQESAKDTRDIQHLIRVVKTKLIGRIAEEARNANTLRKLKDKIFKVALQIGMERATLMVSVLQLESDEEQD